MAMQQTDKPTSEESRIRFFRSNDHARQFRKANCARCKKALKCVGDAELSVLSGLEESKDYMLYHSMKRDIARRGQYVDSPVDEIGRCLKLRDK